MQQFEFHVYDIWSRTPSVMFVVTKDADSARTLAERTRREVKRCTHVEVWQLNHRLFTVGQPSEPMDGAQPLCGPAQTPCM